MASDPVPPLQLHFEPDKPIELFELTGALGAVARQFEAFAVHEGLTVRAKDAQLLVSSVRPGSIDIGLLPDLATYGPLLGPLVPLGKVLQFGVKLKALLDAFRKKEPPPFGVTVKECEDVGAIVAPIAHNGGHQTINVFNGDVYQQVVRLNGEEAMQIAQNASRIKTALQNPAADTRQRVAMIWSGMDIDKPRTTGTRNPDKGIIEEIDPKARPVFFEDEFSYLKREMLEGISNPYRKVYFVDVSISRVEGRVVAYKIIGFHGADDRETDEA